MLIPSVCCLQVDDQLELGCPHYRQAAQSRAPYMKTRLKT